MQETRRRLRGYPGLRASVQQVSLVSGGGFRQTPFNLMSQIGLLILMGVVVNNGIVLLDHMNQLRADGLGRDEAILQAGRDRLRAILMTAATTIIGLLPMAVGGSRVGGLFYFPLALTLIGGLVSSTLLTLLILPTINLRIEAMADWLRRLFAAQPATEPPADAIVEGELAVDAAS